MIDDIKNIRFIYQLESEKVSLPEKAGPERTCQGSADAKAKTGPLP
jgi:hypothetical protein